MGSGREREAVTEDPGRGAGHFSHVVFLCRTVGCWGERMGRGAWAGGREAVAGFKDPTCRSRGTGAVHRVARMGDDGYRYVRCTRRVGGALAGPQVGCTDRRLTGRRVGDVQWLVP